MDRPLDVLIVEDQPADADLIVFQLRRAGFEPRVHRVDTEGEYLAALDAHLLDAPLDVILSDFQMPDFNGLRALELLQSRDLDIPFLIVSGTIGEDQAVEVMRRGAADYLLKDRPARLGPAVAHALDQSRLRQARRRAEEALAESEARYRLLIEQAADGIFIVPQAGAAIEVNRRGVELLGYTREGLQSLQLHDLVAADDVGRVREEIARLGRGETRVGEWRLRRHDGSLLDCEISARQLSDGRLLGILRDLTDRRRIDAQLRQSQKLEAIGQLASGVAHDFNNLLTVIRGNAALIAALDDGRASDHAHAIAHAAERAATLTRQLLLFSRRQVIQPVDLDLGDIVTTTGRMLQRVLGERIAVVTTRTERPATVHADPGLIELALLNLAVNARDAMPRGGELTLTVRRVDPSDSTGLDVERGARVRLEVRDTGTGIPPEVLPRIFEPFFTTKPIGQGTGLGLSSVYGIVLQHGGSIAVRTGVDEGTVFTIEFPAAAVVHPERTAPDPTWMPPGDETILVVEDEPTLRMLVAEILERCGYRILAAGASEEALDLWHRHPDAIDLLLTDLVMPGPMTGREVADHLRHERPSLRVVYTSGYTADVVAPGLGLVEGQDYLQKPFTPQSLARTVRRALDSAQP